MKNILLLGATGTAGSAITKELLKEEDILLHYSQDMRVKSKATVNM